MDPLFERRNLSKKVHIHSKFLQKNIQASILAQLKMNFEGRCSPEGFIQPKSITILDYSLGRTNYIKGGVDYDVLFQCDVCMPHTGQQFKAVVTVRSKIGIHAHTSPIQVLIPRDLHIGNEEFDTIKVGEEVTFQVVGTQFKQQDREIVVLATLGTKVSAPVELPLLTPPPPPTVDVPSGDEKKVVVAAEEKPKTRKLKLKQKVGGSHNESSTFGEIEGKD
jgi:DNA-directed RNA polymerase subunit E'/Rpb7